MVHRQNIVWVLTLGVFAIINTEMGVIGILPLIAEAYRVSLPEAGLLISLFAFAVAIAGPTMPLLFSGMNRKHAMLMVLALFCAGNLVSAFTGDFLILVAARVIPAFFHPVYCSLAFTVAASSVKQCEAPKAVAKVLVGVSAGMVLGVPVVSYMANTFSLRIGMLSFAAVTVVVLVATFFLVPSLPVKEKLSYGSQLQVLKKRSVWLAILAVLFLNGAIFGVYGFFADFLESVTGLPGKMVGVILLVYGVANIAGNVIGGKQLSRRPISFTCVFPFMLGIVYLLLLLGGQSAIWAVALTLVWGILAGAGANINQYLLMSAASEAPDFANGLFLTSTNLGTMSGTLVSGFFISSFGLRASVLEGLLFLLPCVILIAMIFPLKLQNGNRDLLH